MATDKKITDLTELVETTANDRFVVVHSSANETKQITLDTLSANLTGISATSMNVDSNSIILGNGTTSTKEIHGGTQTVSVRFEFPTVTANDTILLASATQSVNNKTISGSTINNDLTGNVTGDVTGTATAANTLTGMTTTVSEINLLDGLTANATELNVLDGISATTADLNQTSGLTSKLALVDNITPGTVEASKAVTVNSTLGATFSSGTINFADIVVAGNLTVQGTQTILNTNIVEIDDNVIKLNAEETGAPSENGGIEIERGTSDNVLLRWNEASDIWEYTVDGSNYQEIVSVSKSQTLTNKVLTNPQINDTTSITANSSEINILDGATVSTSELNILDGVNANSTHINNINGLTANSTELNVLDGFTGNSTNIENISGLTANSTELNILDGATLTTAELNYVDGVTSAIQSQIDGKAATLGDLGVTSSAAELNILDGVTANSTELNSLDGITANSAELNILDGVTANSTELNYVEGVTSSIQTQLDDKLSSTGAQAALDVDHLITLSGVSAASDHLGTFSGSTITDSSTIKTALQELETALEAAEETNAINAVYTGILGVSASDANFGTFDGSTIADNQDAKEALQALETAVETKQNAITSSARLDASLIHDGSVSNTEFGLLGSLTANSTELNVLDGITSTTSELNILNGYTGTAADIATTATFDTILFANTTELSIKTAKNLDINSHDGSAYGLKLAGALVTATAAELNILDGVTANSTELNILDGVTANSTELNYVDGVTSSIQTQIDTKIGADNPSFTGRMVINEEENINRHIRTIDLDTHTTTINSFSLSTNALGNVSITSGTTDAGRAAATYENVAFTTSGSGTGLDIDITVNNTGGASITAIDTLGTNFDADDTITIPSSNIGGGTTDLVITVESTHNNHTCYLPTGTAGQIKVIALQQDNGDVDVEVSNAGWKASGSGTVTFTDIGQTVTCQYLNSKWFLLSSGPGAAGNTVGIS